MIKNNENKETVGTRIFTLNLTYNKSIKEIFKS